MNDADAFARLVQALQPWASQLVFVGGWAHRLYRQHPDATPPAHAPVATLDADVAFNQGRQLEGSIRARLEAAGFRAQLRGDHHPPVSRYALDGQAGGFYAEFLTPMHGPEYGRDGKPLATQKCAGVTAQRLRYLDLLLRAPWQVHLDSVALDVHIPNPVCYIVQKLLIHDRRTRDKQAQDVLYIHDTLELLAPRLDALAQLWTDQLRVAMNPKWVRRTTQAVDGIFGHPSDTLRDAAAIPVDRNLNHERLRAMCHAILGEILQ